MTQGMTPRGGMPSIAHTLPEPNASTRILEKVGLRRDGEARDPEVGVVWRWARPTGERPR